MNKRPKNPATCFSKTAKVSSNPRGGEKLTYAQPGFTRPARLVRVSHLPAVGVIGHESAQGRLALGAPVVLGEGLKRFPEEGGGGGEDTKGGTTLSAK